MWFLVSVVKGSRHYEPDSPIGNRVLICDTSELVISGRASYSNSYRFEGRVGNESYVVGEFSGAPTSEVLVGKFMAMAKQMGAVAVGADAAA
jgi:hypothetical protein